MIRMIQSTSAAHAKNYYASALAVSDYYMEGQEINGHIQGKLADRIGISGPCDAKTFFDLCDGINPKSKGRLTPRTKFERTAGYDINFHCPKSVSVISALSKDSHVIDAFRASVHATMKEIEKDAKTRVRKNDVQDERDTGELIWADFIHQTSRPVDGNTPDPHLHAHAFVFNATYDVTENRIKATQFRTINQNMPYYQARFEKDLSDKLSHLGYKIRRTNKSFEVVGVPQRIIDHFSKRTDQIGRIAKEAGITDAKELDALGARTRSKKEKGLSMPELKEDWKRQIRELGPLDKDDGKEIVRFDEERPKETLSAQQCVDHAVKHSFERASVIQDRRLLANALRHGIGDNSVTAEAISDAFDSDKRLLRVTEKSKTMVTTKGILREEQQMVEMAKSGKGAMKPIYYELPEIKLEGEQGQAVKFVLSTSNRVSIIRGAAGTGKTTMMKEAVSHMENAGKRVTVVAPSSQAARGVLRAEGFEKAETVAHFLVNPKMQADLKDQVLWVDEAGLLGVRDMSALLKIATDQNAKLILGGDTRQHSAVLRGDALRILNTVGGVRTAEISRIYRQRSAEYRDAVQDLSKGDVYSGFLKLDEMQAIKEIDPMKPNERLVEDYVDAVKRGKSTLVISPTHQHGDNVTDAIREKLRSEKLIGKNDTTITRLVDLNLTEAEKSDWRSIREGQTIQFNQNGPDFKRGSMWTVAKSSEKEVLIGNNQGRTTKLPLDRSKDFDVFTKSEINIAKGDKVRITRNGFDKAKNRMSNGHLMEVVSARKNGDILMRNKESKKKYKVPSDYGHIAHAHCVTSHFSQGKTVDEVFLSQPAATFPATDSKQFYVSVSRARDQVHVYTDDKEQLLIHAAEIGDRLSATELVNKMPRADEKMVQQQIRADLARLPEVPEDFMFDKLEALRNERRLNEPGI